MQPEQLPPDHQEVTSSWHYVTLLPTLVGFIGVSITFFAWIAGWGGGQRIAQLLAGGFSVLMLLVSAAGLLGYLKQPGRYRRLRMIALWNLFLLLAAFLCGLLLLLS